MVRLSEDTVKLLKDDILSILNENPSRSRFTKEIAKELRRDKEFTLKLLLEMKKLNWVEEVFGKNARGNRKRWRISKGLLKAWDKEKRLIEG
ncbi:hypothetical protein HYV89_02600 [Candidatus Woesearchaeota archaeon]|nr:hypothetical protein [Candidatus Woesearchaeota archaeon]